MRTFNLFVVKLKDRLKDTITSESGFELYVDARFDDFKNRVTEGPVVCVPFKYDTGVEVGDTLYFHHLVVLGGDNNGQIFTQEDNTYIVNYDPNHAISNQAIANTYASWAWGSGVGGANNLMQSVLINDYGYELSQVSSKYSRVAILNELSQKNSEELFNRLIEARENYFRSLSDFSVFGNGWLNRLRDFKKYNQKYVDNAFGGINRQIITAVAILLIILIFTYFAIK